MGIHTENWVFILKSNCCRSIVLYPYIVYKNRHVLVGIWIPFNSNLKFLELITAKLNLDMFYDLYDYKQFNKRTYWMVRNPYVIVYGHFDLLLRSWLIWVKYLHFKYLEYNHWEWDFHRYRMQLLIKGKLKVVDVAVAGTFVLSLLWKPNKWLRIVQSTFLIYFLTPCFYCITI